MSSSTEAEIPPKSPEAENTAGITLREQAFVPEISLHEVLNEPIANGIKEDDRDAASRTSTRLVKFQLFETKAVFT
jgi:hypothetical protein